MSEDMNLREFVDGNEPNDGEMGKDLHLPEIDKIPEDWDLVTIEDIAKDLIGGGTPSKNKAEYWNGDIPWASVKDLNGIVLDDTEDHITQSGLENSATNLIPANSIIISTRMTVGEPFLNRVEMAINQDMKAILPKNNKINSLFLVYSLWDKDSYLKSLGRGTTVDGITTRDLSLTHLGLPSLSEQRKIATLLRSFDRAIKKTQEIVGTYQSVQEGILRDLIHRGVTEDGELRSDSDENPDSYSETRWGEIPNKWDVREVSELVLDDRPVTYGIVKAGDHVQDGIPMIRGENYIDGWEPMSNFFKVSPEIHNEYTRSTVRSGDILIAVAGANAGAVNIVPEWMPDEVNISRSTARISVDESDVIPEYMRFVLESPFLRKQIHAWKKGSAQDVLNLNDVKKFQIPLPTIEEQERIVSILSNIREGAIKERKLKNQYSRIKQALMQDLLSGTVRTTDTNIEVPEEVAQYG